MSDLMTPAEAAALCGVQVATIWQWKRRGILAPAGLDERGRSLYSQLDVARAEAATRARARRTVDPAAA
ncbi:MerR family transcriptional regulator [Kitasatospora sp. NPDC057692]|uniref:MerR family transcriptional regulator n=1 Tax=Kitasatospora sp. NPDC057692 TaxID=3346215 RepID=UPI0036822265